MLKPLAFSSYPLVTPQLAQDAIDAVENKLSMGATYDWNYVDTHHLVQRLGWRICAAGALNPRAYNDPQHPDWTAMHQLSGMLGALPRGHSWETAKRRLQRRAEGIY